MVEFGKILQEKNYLKNLKYKFENCYEVTFILRNGYEIPLIIFFSALFPIELPFVFVNKEKSHIIRKPHILSDGYICYLDKEGVVWSDNPSIALDLVFERIERVMLETNDIVEYHREFNYYFGTLKNLTFATFLFSSGDKIEEVYRYKEANDHVLIYKDDDKSILMMESFLGKKIRLSPNNKALFIPLKKVYTGRVPQQDMFWSAEEIGNLIRENISSEQFNLLKRYAANKREYFYILEMTLLTGDKVTIGLCYRKKDNKKDNYNPIIEPTIGNHFDIFPIFISKYNDNSLIQRGGGVINESKILIIGCGSVGSDILFLLARSGLKNFDLVDKENLNLVNSYRHFLGTNYAVKNRKKVLLLKEEVERRYPELNITPYDQDILKYLQEKTIIFDDYDLVIIALGDPNIERYLNKMIIETKTPAIFAWVEAYGLGGHALLINNGGTGCYECLFNDGKRLKRRCMETDMNF